MKRRICLQQSTIFMRTILSALLLFSLTSMMAQENCTNGIDDDNDGLIDLLDPDCVCGNSNLFVVNSNFPNPSFEEGECPATSDCDANNVDGWINPSQGTPDYWIDCNSPNAGLPTPPCPVPDGSDCLGIIHNGPPSNILKEYVGTILTEELTQGVTYKLSIWVGFLGENSGTVQSREMNLVIYGNVSSTNIIFNTIDCPDNYPLPTPWEPMASIQIENKTNGWKQFEVEFTPTENIRAVIMGPDCNQTQGFNYYYFDNLILTEKGNYNIDVIIVESGQGCNNNKILSAPHNEHLTYQWYKDGIAIPGATSYRFAVPGGIAAQGDYQVRVANGYTCTVSAPYTHEFQYAEVEITGATGLCPGEDLLLEVPDTFQTFNWNNGIAVAQNNIDQAGMYAVAVSNADGCIAYDTVEIGVWPEADFFIQTTNETAVGAADGQAQIIYSTPIQNAVVRWEDGSTNTIRTNLSKDMEVCATVYGDSTCVREVCAIIGQDIAPLDISVLEQYHVRCHAEHNGSIKLNITGGIPPYTLDWTGHPTWKDESSLSDLPAGTYEVQVQDSDGRSLTEAFTITQPEELSLSFEIEKMSCFNVADAQITALVTGGTRPYTYLWSNGGQDSLVQDLRDGNYRLEVIDAQGCVIQQNATVARTLAITADVDWIDAACIGNASGSININWIYGGHEPYTIYLDGVLQSSNLMTGLAGESRHEVQIVDAEGCILSDSVFINYSDSMQLSLGPDFFRRMGQQYTIQPQSNLELIEYTWEVFADGMDWCETCAYQELEIESDGLAILHARSIEGCYASDTVKWTTAPSKNIYIPNAISPNDDGVNDYFEIFGTAASKEIIRLSIYNSSGAKQFEVFNLPFHSTAAEWTARLKDWELPMGIYTYYVEILFDDDTSEAFKGSVFVKR